MEGVLFTVNNGISSHKTNYVEIFSEIFFYLGGHQNRCIGSKVRQFC